MKQSEDYKGSTEEEPANKKNIYKFNMTLRRIYFPGQFQFVSNFTEGTKKNTLLSGIKTEN
jgi:hypothetical protein